MPQKAYNQTFIKLYGMFKYDFTSNVRQIVGEKKSWSSTTTFSKNGNMNTEILFDYILELNYSFEAAFTEENLCILVLFWYLDRVHMETNCSVCFITFIEVCLTSREWI